MREGFSEERVVLLGISGVDGVKVFQLVARLGDSQSLLGPVDGGVCDVESGESKDDIFLSAIHDIEEMFLSDPFNVGVEGASGANHTGFVCGLVYISDHDRRSKLLGGESMFSDKLPVYTGDISTRVYQCGGVDDF